MYIRTQEFSQVFWKIGMYFKQILPHHCNVVDEASCKVHVRLSQQFFAQCWGETPTPCSLKSGVREHTHNISLVQHYNKAKRTNCMQDALYSDCFINESNLVLAEDEVETNEWSEAVWHTVYLTRMSLITYFLIVNLFSKSKRVASRSLANIWYDDAWQTIFAPDDCQTLVGEVSAPPLHESLKMFQAIATCPF